MGTVVAYVRVSTKRQEVKNQRYEIMRYANAKSLKVNRWIAEVVSGTVSPKDRQLEREVSMLTRGDTLIVTELSRLSRSLLEILALMQPRLGLRLNG